MALNQNSDDGGIKPAASAASADGPQQQQIAVSTAKISTSKDEKVTIKKKDDATITYFSLFRYADKQDWILMTLGTIGGAINGASLPMFAIIFGDLLNSFGGGNPCADYLESGGSTSTTTTATTFTDADAINAAANDSLSKVNTYCLYFFYLALATLVASFLQNACWMWTGARQANRVRGLYLHATLRQDVAYFDKDTTTGQLLLGLNEDTMAFQNAISEKVGNFLQNSFAAITGIIIAFVRGWALTLIVLAMTPALALFGALISTLSAKAAKKANEAYALANTISQQAFANIRTVQAFNGEKKAGREYATSLEVPYKVGVKQGFLQGFVIGATNACAFTAYCVAFWYGGYQVSIGVYTGGQVMSIIFAALMGGFALGQAVPMLKFFREGRVAATSLFTAINHGPVIDLDAPGDTIPTSSFQATLQFQQVHFTYPSRPDKPVFTELDLTMPAGKTVAIVGESGSGKSTIVQLIQRFYDPLQGYILLDGRDLKGLQLKWLRQQMGYVGQEPMLFATTIRDNILYGCPTTTDSLEEPPTQDDVIAAAKAANAHDFITKLPLGYDTQTGEKGIQISGGQKQRIAIARAIIRNPRILLLDEATSALDAESEALVQEALENLMVGRTTVVVAHRLSTVINADSIAVLKEGQVVEQGPHDALLSIQNGFYATLVATQAAAGSAPDHQHGGGHGGHDAAMQPAAERRSFRAAGSSASKQRLSMVGKKPRAISEEEMEQGGDIDDSGDGDVDIDTTTVIDGVVVSSNGGDTSGGATFRKKRGLFTTTLKNRKGDKKKKENHDGNDNDKDGKTVGFTRLASYTKPEWLYFTVGVFASALLGMTLPGFSLGFANILSVFFTPAGPNCDEEIMSGSRKWALVFLAIALGSWFLATVQCYSLGVVGNRLALRLRVLLFKAILRQNIGWFDEKINSSGALVAKLSTDTICVRGAVADQVALLIQNLVTMIAAYIIAFVASWSLTLVITATVPILGVAGYYQTLRVAGFQTDAEKLNATANQTAAEAMGSIRTIAAFSLQDKIVDLYQEGMLKPERVLKRQAVTAGLGFGFSQFVLFSVFSLCFWFGGTQVEAGNIDLNDMLKAFFAIFMAAQGVAQAQMAFPDITKAGPAAKRVFSTIDRIPSPDAGDTSGKKPSTIDGDLELKNVTFAYPSRPEVTIFKNLTLSVPAGSSLAVVGESGSGKSTIISLIERFYDPLEGAILLDGIDIKTLNLKFLRRHIGLVNQEPILFSASALENIRYGTETATMEEVIAAATTANAIEFINKMPETWDTKLGEGGVQLSGGQKQRVAIARAILKNPRVLLLDEATSALDAESERLVQEALDEVMVDRTTLIVAHRLSTIRNADYIAVVSEGKIIEQGRHEVLMEKLGSYARLVRHQSSIRSGRLSLA